MQHWNIDVLMGSGTTTYVVTVWACSLGSAYWKCRREGMTPLCLSGCVGFGTVIE